jgi:hypothetical protein
MIVRDASGGLLSSARRARGLLTVEELETPSLDILTRPL